MDNWLDRMFKNIRQEFQMRFNFPIIVYNFIVSILTTSLTISFVIIYIENISNLLATSMKMLFAEYLLIVFLSLLLLIFIVLQILSKNNIYKKIMVEPIEFPEKDEIIYLFAIIILTIVGFYLRFIQLNDQSFWIDEAITANAAISLLHNGIPIFPSGFIYDRSILNTLFVALSFKTFGINEFAGRLPGIIFGTLSIIVTYLLGKKIGNKNIGLAAAILMTFSLWEIAGSRQARMYIQLQFFYIYALYLFYSLVEDKKLKYAPLLVLAFVSAIVSHSFGYSLIAIFFIYLILTKIIIARNLSKFRILFKTTKDILVIFTSLLSIGIFFLFFGKEIIGIVSIVTNTNDQFIFYKNVLANTYSELYYFFIAGVVISVGAMLIMKRKKELLLILAFFIPFYIISYHLPFVGMGYGARYLYFLLPIFFIFSAYLFGWLIEIQKIDTILGIKNQQIFSVCLTVAIILIIIAPSINAFSFSPKEYYSINLDSDYTNHKKAFSFVKNNMQENDKLVSIVPPLALYYTGKSDYSLLIKNVEDFSISANGTQREIYANSLVISNKSMLEQILKNNNVWIVMDKAYKSHASEDVLKFIQEKLFYHAEVSDKMTNVYSWSVMPQVTISTYSDDFNTDKWNYDKDSSYGIERSEKIIHTKYVLYPIVVDTQAYVKYNLNFNNTVNKSTIEVTGNRRDTEHNLSVWGSQDNKKYNKIIDFDKPSDATHQTDITSYIKNNQSWIEFRFFRSSKGENTPRILDFSITAVAKDNESVKITPFRKDGQNVSSIKVLSYNPTNHIKEPSFEHYKDSDNPPIAWSFTSDNGAQAIVDTNASAGNYSFRTSVKNATSGNADLSQLFAINGSKYLFNVSYKQMGSGNSSALIQWMNAQGKEIGNEKIYLYPNTSWNRFSFEKYIPANTTQGKVILRYQTRKGDSGTVWFDDVQLYSARED